MNKITIFNFESKSFQAISDELGEPWFNAGEICGILGYENHRKALSDHCKPQGVTTRYGLAKDGKQRKISFINEGNFYRLVVKCRLPIGEKLEAYVCDEVLPSIRKTGGYNTTIEKSPLEGQLYQAVCEKTKGDGNARHWLWGRLNAHFGLSSYKNLPTAQFENALQFVASIAILPMMTQAALPAPKTRSATPEELIACWFEPNNYLFDSDFLARLAQACIARLLTNAEYQKSKANGKTMPLVWATPIAEKVTDPFQGRSGSTA